jgi:hypothetical protein
VNPLKVIIAVLLVGLLIGVSKGDGQPSSTSFSGFDSTMLVNGMDDAIIYCGSSTRDRVRGGQYGKGL